MGQHAANLAVFSWHTVPFFLVNPELVQYPNVVTIGRLPILLTYLYSSLSTPACTRYEVDGQVFEQGALAVPACGSRNTLTPRGVHACIARTADSVRLSDSTKKACI